MIFAYQKPLLVLQNFANFAKDLIIFHQTGAVSNHQANSIADSVIQTIKHLMVKNQNETWLALLILKSMPISGTDESS